MKNVGTFAQLNPLPLHSTVWSKGFWHNQFNLAKDSILPNIYRLFDDDKVSHCLANFRIAAGLQKGMHSGPPFADGDFYKWLEAACYVYGATHDAALKEKIDSSVDLIQAIQRPDGYIFTYYSIQLQNGVKEEKLGNSLNFEAYNLGHLITASCVHANVTKENTLLDVGVKAARCLKDLFEEAERKRTAKTAICPSHYMGLIDLYRLTGDSTHIDTAQLAIRLRDRVVDGTDDNQDRINLLEHDEMLGHAVRATYLYAGVADLFIEKGNESLYRMLERVFKSAEYHKTYINSGVGALYDGVSPAGYAGDNPNLARTHQAFGRPYELPNLTAYNETCGTVGNILFNWRMLRINAQAIHAERIEQSFYNLILASVSRDGLLYFYANPLAREQEALPFHLKWDRTRTPYLSSFCCPPNMLRLIAQSSEYAYAQREEGVAMVLYGDSEVAMHFNGEEVLIRQETEYPYSGEIKITFEKAPKKEFTLFIRIPSWVKKGSLTHGSKTMALDPKDANTYIPLKNIWKDGEAVSLSFDMTPQLITAHPLLESTIHQVAVMRGPLVYCIEELDHPEVDFSSLGISHDASFVLGSKTVRGETIVTLESDDGLFYRTPAWDNKTLYRNLPIVEVQKTKLTFIPYFAWDNRGLGGMKVWLPLYL